MAGISFEKNMSINPDWGVDNLMKAIDAGSALDRITPEEHAKAQAMFNAEFSEEAIARFRERIRSEPK